MYGVFNGLIRQASREKNDRLNLFYRIEELAGDKKLADEVVLIFEGRKYTNKQFYDIILRYGTLLKNKYDIKPKDIVAMLYGNSDVYLFIWLGLWSIGARPAFINTNLTNKPLVHSIKTSTAKLVIVDPQYETNITTAIQEELSMVHFVNFTPQLEAEAHETHPIRQPDSTRTNKKASDMALLIFTSGTTGLPKAAHIGWNKFNAASLIFAHWLGFRRSDIFYTSMPLYHSSASILGVATTITAGSTVCIGRKFSTKVFWQEVRDSNATIIQYVGETLRYLLSAPPEIDSISGKNLDKKHRVRIAFGNGLRPDVWNRFKDRFGIETIAEFYAATEGSGATWNLSRNDFSKGAIGRGGLIAWLLSGSRAIVEVDWETEQPWRDPVTRFCKKAAIGEPGELLYKLDPLEIEKNFQGYFGNEKASQSKIMRDVLVKGDAYFRTGDTVRYDAEGRTFFSDRIGDTFRWKGENVSTNEVSEVLGHHLAVKEANVYGVELPNHDGRAGCVAIILTEEPSQELMSSLAQHVKEHLPRYATPLFLRVTKGMELTGTNKQQKHMLRAHGVNPDKVGADKLYWLKDGNYVKFKGSDWQQLLGGKIKL